MPLILHLEVPFAPAKEKKSQPTKAATKELTK